MQVEVSSWLVVEDGRPVGVQAICRDVSERRDAEHALLQRAFEETDVGMFVARPSGRIERANAAFCRMLGYTAFELRRLDVVEITHPDDRADTSASLVQLVDGKLSRYRREKRYIRKNGDVVRVQLGVSPVTDSTGAVVSLIAQAVDVTRVAARRESEARFRRLFDASPQGIAVVSHEGRVLQANPALGQILGYATEELVGLAFTDFTHPDDCSADVELFTKLMAGELAHYELEKRFIRKDGTLVWGQYHGVRASRPRERPTAGDRHPRRHHRSARARGAVAPVAADGGDRAARRRRRARLQQLAHRGHELLRPRHRRVGGRRRAGAAGESRRDSKRGGPRRRGDAAAARLQPAPGARADAARSQRGGLGPGAVLAAPARRRRRDPPRARSGRRRRDDGPRPADAGGDEPRRQRA